MSAEEMMSTGQNIGWDYTGVDSVLEMIGT